MTKNSLLKKVIVSVILVSLVFNIQMFFAEENNKVENAKSGIVEIYSGFRSQSGKFYKVKSASGFIVTNSDEGAYIITNNHSVALSEKDKKTYCKISKITYDNSYTNAIVIVVKGDVSSELSVVAQSVNEDYCILHSDNVVSEKSAVTLGNSSSVAIGDSVYVMGFTAESSSNAYSQFDESEVEIHEGKVQDNNAQSSKFTYIQHSAVINSGNTGGATLDSQGNVVGLNNSSMTDDSINAYYSLPIDTIKNVLDNYKINYKSVDKIAKYDELTALYQECTDLSKNTDYTSDSRQQLSEVVESLQITIQETTLDTKTMQEAIDTLNQAKNALEKGTQTSVIVIWVMAFVVVLLAFIFVKLLLFNRKFKAKESKADEVKEEALVEEPNKPEDSTEQKESLKPLKEEKLVETNVSLNKIKGMDFDNEEEKTFILPVFQKEKSGETNVKNTNHKAKINQLRTGKVAIIDKDEFLLGKVEDLTDFAVEDNRAVSRVHATIRYIDGKYFIYDLNSANGTYVNSEKVTNEGVELKSEDSITLANENFLFEELS
jgi:S1-C subfamily serine protease